jgi:predicted transcriptional regulator
MCLNDDELKGAFAGIGTRSLAVFSIEKEGSIVGNRTRVEILASILTVAHKGALKTHIMYKANLSHRQLEKYLGFLIGNGMIAKRPDTEYGGTYYEVTLKGVEFLKDYARLSQTYGQDILRIR